MDTANAGRQERFAMAAVYTCVRFRQGFLSHSGKISINDSYQTDKNI
jgi:hypothetical protein